jgi:undecaprenyl-diphosphatase
MPEWLSVVLLGIIEGLTEFIPVSSTGHLLLAAPWLPPRQSDLFFIVIQSGAVIAVLPIFWERVKKLTVGLRDPSARDLLYKIIAAFAFTGVGGLILDYNQFTLPEETAPVAWALVIGGVLFILAEKFWTVRKPLEEVTWTIALIVGIGQLIAMIFPGASRSGSTILLSLLFGLKRPAAVEFSFLVGIPTMLAAGGLKIYRTLSVPEAAAQENWGMVLLGGVVAAIVSFAAVKWLLSFIQTHTFIPFGWYRIVVGVLILWLAGA